MKKARQCTPVLGVSISGPVVVGSQNERQHLLKEIAYNPAVQDANAKIAAHDLAADMIWAVTKLSINTPAFVIRHTKFMQDSYSNIIKNNPTVRAIVEQKDLMQNLPSPLNPFE